MKIEEEKVSVEIKEVLFLTPARIKAIINGEEMIDAFEAGIIDPTKVVRCSLENAAAAAVTLLMTECVINDKPGEKKKDAGFDMAGLGM